MSKKYKPLITWTTEDIEIIAEDTGHDLTEEQIENIYERLVDELNDWDILNSMIVGAIEDAIKEECGDDD